MKSLPPYTNALILFILATVVLFVACNGKSTLVTPDTPTFLPTATNTILSTATNLPVLLPTQAPTLQVTTTPTQPAEPTQPPTVTPLPNVQPDPNDETLRAYAAKRGKFIGAAVDTSLVRQSKYAEVLVREFNFLTTENAIKWSLIQPERYRYDWVGADELVNFALAHDMKVRGQTLIWQQQIPDWLKYTNWTRDELISVLKDHITNVVGRYKGRVYVWDVVNEATFSDGEVSTPFWSKQLGPDYIDLAFETAHQADPDAILFYNDYDAEYKKSDEVYKMVKSMKARGIPIDGVGLQFPTDLNMLPPLDQISENIKRLGDLGLQVHITELDIRIKDPPTPEQLEQQAQNYRDILQICLDAPNCTAFIIWGFTDEYSWVPNAKKGYGSALIFDEYFNPEPAYLALLAALKQK